MIDIANIKAKSVRNHYYKEIKNNKLSIGKETNVCPKCGKLLVRRTNKKDGSKFIGCSNYPKCKYTRNIDDIINKERSSFIDYYK